MSSQKLICAGFGGQGVMSLGQLLAYAGMIEGKEVTWLPSYGPEMRGGTAYCCVNISDRPIGSPLISDDADCAIVMNLPSFHKFEPLVVPGGRVLVNSSLIDQQSTRADLQACYIPANEIAVSCGNEKMANMVMLGAYLKLTSVVSELSVMKAFAKVFKKNTPQLRKQNKEALKRGAACICGQVPLNAAI
jgi:2-oxoglutarate ferredoxin oxidoreductase subunit gamma